MCTDCGCVFELHAYVDAGRRLPVYRTLHNMTAHVTLRIETVPGRDEDSMAQAQAQTRCGFPGCPNERVPAPAGGGRPSAYCADPAHNAASAFRARRAVQQRDAGTDQDQDQPG